MKEKLKQKKGITLIALVITIIVLLILAGVSIAMLTGENGILSQAQKSSIQTEIGKEEEDIALAYNGAKAEKNGGDVYADDLNRNFGYNDTVATATDVGDTIKVTFTESQRTYTIDANGNISEVEPPETDENGLYVNTSTKDGGEATAMNPTIPAGFKPVDTETSSWGNEGEAPTSENVNDGLVIEDGSGNQFVWIPVATPVANVEADGTTNKAMAIKTGENYRGLFYDFTSSGSTVKSGCTTTTISDREPDVVTEYDAQYYTYAGYNSLDEMKQGLQSEYNKMMQSVEEYHGFYVGRYELGLEINNSNAPTSRKAENGVTTADNRNSATSMWYGLYCKCKEFAPEKDNKAVVSSMIWGSQYDAMMNWMQSNDIEVNAKPDGINTIKNSSYETGSEPYDIVKNVFDLYGCHNEWTLGASIHSYRIGKGGYRYDGNNTLLITHMDNWPANNGSNGGNFSSTRITLYVK